MNRPVQLPQTSSAEATPVDLQSLLEQVRHYAGIAHKADIQQLQPAMAKAYALTGYPNGDDCAVLPAAQGYQLLAIEGFMNRFVEHDPWFAGWCGVMVNVSDIAAMGGKPVAVVNALWGQGAEQASLVMEGMAAASRAYQVPIVGGHTNLRSDQEQLSVAILGQADALLSSFAARAGQDMVMAVDLRGNYQRPFLNWNAATSAPAERLRGDLALLPLLAEQGLATAAKDISQAGTLGTLIMLLECSGVGAEIELEAIPRPAGVDWQDWLCSFPSFGFLLSCAPEHTAQVLAAFHQRDLAAARIGHLRTAQECWVSRGDQRACFWNIARTPLTGMSSG